MTIDVHRAIAETARQMHASAVGEDGGTDRVLEAITAGAIEHVPGAQYAGVLLVSKDKTFRTLAPTDPLMNTLDRLQKETDQGPCLEAAWEQPMVRVDEIETDPRWPDFSARVVAETPARSSMSFQLFTHQGSQGALNLFSDKVGAFDTESAEIGLVYATHAALALHASKQFGGFASAIARRDVIGQAKGMIMAEYKVDAVQAFEMLRKLSQDTNTPVVTLAEQVVESRLQ